MSAMVIHFYGKNDELLKTFSRSFVPWKLLKKAVGISALLNMENMTEEDVDVISGLVVAVFGDQFSVDELNECADVGEMVAVLNTIITRASGGMGNPIQPG